MRYRFHIALVMACTAFFSLACLLFMPGRGPLVFQPETLPEAQVGAPYEAKISITGNVTPAGAFSVQENTLPPGLTMETLQDENAARVFGTPTKAGTYKFSVFVWCYGTNVSGQTGEKEYTLLVK